MGNKLTVVVQNIWDDQLLEELKQKAEKDKECTIKILEAFEKVYNGEEPDDILKEISLVNPIGENPEALLKAYKWIWGQEDVNYPTGKGREMSWVVLKELWENLKGV